MARLYRELFRCVTGAALFTAQIAFAQATFQFDLPAQPLADSLRAVGRITHTNVLFDPPLVDGLRAPALKASLTPDQAFTRLLTGTPLKGKFLDDTTVTIARITASAAPPPLDPPTGGRIAADEEGKTKSYNGFRMAQVDQGAPSSTSTGERAQPSKDKSEKVEESTVNTPEILIKGSRILNVDVKRTEDDVQPYYILDSNQIERSGATNVEDFLKNRLTMNTTIQSNSQSSTSQSPSLLGATSTINLRGLGANETLILIDGRRSASVSLGTSVFQPDINGIPLSAIERIEVLPSSASAIYGGAALGGVVNIILKKNYHGGEFNITYENTTKTDAPLRTVNATYGLSFEDGKTQVMLTGHYSDGHVLLTQDRAGFIERGYSTILRNDPGFFISNPSTPILGATPNIGSADGATNLTLKSTGASLNSPIATIAPGASAATASSIIAGQWNYTLAPTAETNGLLNAMGSVPRIKSLMAALHRELTPTVELFTEFSTESNSSTSRNDPIDTNAGLFVPASSPANPFNQDVNVSFPNTLVTPFLTDSVTQSVTVGSLVRLPRDWKSEVDYTWSRNSFESLVHVDDSVALGSALATGTVNPFADSIANPLNLTPYVAVQAFSGRSSLNDFGLRASGPVGLLPWGRPILTIGLEHRKEGSDDHSNNLYIVYPLTPANSFHAHYFAQSQSTDSIYAEAQVPLVTAKNSVQLIRSLELQLAGRSERYAVDAGTPYVYLLPDGSADLNNSPPQGVHKTIKYTSTNPTIGLKYKPVEDVIFRGSYAKAFLPPTFNQLLPNPTPSAYTTNIIDPQGGQTYGVHLIQGGNPNLKPQTSRDWDLGVIWEPQEQSLKGLRMDLEYYQITQPNYITTPAPQQVVSNPAYTLRVTRDPTSGRITVVDVIYLNATQFKTNGWDVKIDYRKPTSFGTFDLYALGTVIAHDERQYTIDGPSLDYAGYPNDAGEGKIKANLAFSWEYRGWTLGWSATYYGSYTQSNAPGSPSYLQYGPNSYYTDAQGGYTIPSQTYHTIFGSYAFGKKSPISPLSNLTIQFGIKNLFNTLPPFDAFYSPYYYSPYGDPRLRDYWVSVRKGF